MVKKWFITNFVTGVFIVNKNKTFGGSAISTTEDTSLKFVRLKDPLNKQHEGVLPVPPVLKLPTQIDFFGIS